MQEFCVMKMENHIAYLPYLKAYHVIITIVRFGLRNKLNWHYMLGYNF